MLCGEVRIRGAQPDNDPVCLRCKQLMVERKNMCFLHTEATDNSFSGRHQETVGARVKGSDQAIAVLSYDLTKT